MDDVRAMSTDELRGRIETLEQAYRAGQPLVSDEVFDHVYMAELKRREPEDPLLQQVGAEPDFGDGKVVHPSPMLSTDKAYTREELAAFVRRVEASAAKLGFEAEELRYRVTPKLDGMAARFDGARLVTRGDGLKGNDVTSAITKGVVMDRPGVGELVMAQSYFDANLADVFEHPRNVVVGAVAAKELSDEAAMALSEGAIRFVNYGSLACNICSGQNLVEAIDAIVEELVRAVDYPTDGVVIEVIGESIQYEMGSTSHHHRFMVAKKTKGETAETAVVGIEWTTGRTGRVTPTVLIEPVRLSGATLGRVTAHHAGNVRNLQIGEGAILRIIRSGEVIPCVENVITPATAVSIPAECPSCGEPVEWQNDFIVCSGVQCEAQLVRRLHHFFEILGNLDLFGRKSVQKIVDAGHTDLVSIYGLTAEDFEACGFGPKQSENLVAELLRSRTDAVEDWRFLGALGIHHLGRGSSRRLLKVHPIETLDTVSVDEIEAVDSFGPVVAPSVHKDIRLMWPIIRGLLDLGFNLVSSASPRGGVLAGKKVVFTGAMPKPRKEMEADAERLGAEVQKSVSGKTDWLITGERVGATKINKAEKLGVTVMPLAEYEALLGNS